MFARARKQAFERGTPGTGYETRWSHHLGRTLARWGHSVDPAHPQASREPGLACDSIP